MLDSFQVAISFDVSVDQCSIGHVSGDQVNFALYLKQVCLNIKVFLIVNQLILISIPFDHIQQCSSSRVF